MACPRSLGLWAALLTGPLGQGFCPLYYRFLDKRLSSVATNFKLDNENYALIHIYPTFESSYSGLLWILCFLAMERV